MCHTLFLRARRALVRSLIYELMNRRKRTTGLCEVSSVIYQQHNMSGEITYLYITAHANVYHLLRIKPLNREIKMLLHIRFTIDGIGKYWIEMKARSSISNFYVQLAVRV